MNNYWPEDNGYINNLSDEQLCTGKVCYGTVKKCDKKHNMIVSWQGMTGIIPYKESAIGAEIGKIKEISIISKVGKIVSFVPTDNEFTSGEDTYPEWSRRQAQLMCKEEYMASLKSGDVIDAVVTHFEPFGAFVDIGCGIVSLLPIDSISVSRISHPKDRFCIGQKIKVVVTGRDHLQRITVSHKELLGTWCENAEQFDTGETVFGVVRSVEHYGIFVELTPNLAGLAECRDDIEVGDFVSVFIKNILPDKMKIKLIIIDKIGHSMPPAPNKYFINENHIDAFYYSPIGSTKNIWRKF